MLPALSTAVFAFVMGTSWIALLLAELGKFSPLPCLCFGALAAFASFRVSASPRVAVPATTAFAVGVVALIAVATLYFTKNAGELILGGWDPGVYAQTAAHISRTGELLIREPDLNVLTPDELAILTRTTSGIVGPFTGMWMLPDGKLSPQFHHLYPSLMAVAYSCGGIRAALMVNPVLNAGCIVLMFALARRFVRTPFAVAAALLLAVNPAQLWQAKFCTAEMLGQFLLLGGAVFFLDALSQPKKSAEACLAGAAFGLALLARYDSVIFLAPLAAMTIATWPWLSSRRGALITGAAFLPFLIHHLIHHRFFAPYYQPMGGLVLAAMAGLVAAAVVFAVAMRQQAIRDFAVRRARLLRTAAALFVAAWWIFIWLRPHVARWPLLGGADSDNVFYLVAIFGPLLALFALAHVVWIFSERDVPRAIWLYASSAVLLVVATSVFNDHFLMWVARRFVPVVVPLLVLAAAKLLERIVKGRANISVAPSAQRRAVAAALVVALLAMQYKSSRAMAMLRDWPGLVAWSESVASRIPDDARVFCDQRGFAAPLRFLFGKRAYELHLAENDPARFERLSAVMAAAVARGEKVVLLSTQKMSGEQYALIGECPLDSQRMDTSRNMVPRTTRSAGGVFRLFEVRPTR